MAKTYTTQSGDMWDSIAHREMGSYLYTPQLMEANRSLINYFRFPAGVVLQVPDPKVKTDASLPPWKRREVTL